MSGKMDFSVYTVLCAVLIINNAYGNNTMNKPMPPQIGYLNVKDCIYKGEMLIGCGILNCPSTLLLLNIIDFQNKIK